MAYDPEARKQSRTALAVGVVVLIGLIGATMAYMANRPAPETTVITTPARPAPPPTVINNTIPQPIPTTNTVVVVATATPGPPPPVVERNTTIVRDRVVTVPGATPAAAPATGGSNSTNVTVNVPRSNEPPAPKAATPAAPAAAGTPAPGY